MPGHQLHTSLALCHARGCPRVLPILYKPCIVSADSVHSFVSKSQTLPCKQIFFGFTGVGSAKNQVSVKVH